MYENDYIKRMIRQIAVVLARIFANRKIKNYEICHEITDETLKNTFGINRNLLMKVPVQSLVDLICGYDGIENEIIFSLSQLLSGEGDTFKEEDDPVNGKIFYKKALELLEFIDLSENDLLDKQIDEAKIYLIDRLNEL